MKSLASHRRHGIKHTVIYKVNFKWYWLSVIPEKFWNSDDTAVDYVMVKYEATNIISGTGNSISGTAIDSYN